MNKKYTGGESPWNWSQYYFGQKEHTPRPSFFPIAFFIVTVLLNVLPWIFQHGIGQLNLSLHAYISTGLQAVAMILFLIGTHNITEANARYLLDTSNISMITLNKKVQMGDMSDDEAQNKRQAIYSTISRFSNLVSKNKLCLVLNFSSTLTALVNAAIFCAYYRTLLPPILFMAVPSLLLLQEILLFIENAICLRKTAKSEV